MDERLDHIVETEDGNEAVEEQTADLAHDSSPAQQEACASLEDAEEPCSSAETDQPRCVEYGDAGVSSQGPTYHNQEIGRRGENAAARYLVIKGLEILERNWTCPAGEADIIARDGCCLVFCEVKTRTSLEKGLPCEAVTCEKRHKYERIAGYFLKEYDYTDMCVRFDIVDLLVVADDRALVRHFKNAYGVV